MILTLLWRMTPFKVHTNNNKNFIIFIKPVTRRFLIPAKYQETVSSLWKKTDRIAFLYSSLVVDMLTEAVGDSHSALSFSRRDLNPCEKQFMWLFYLSGRTAGQKVWRVG